MDPMGKKSIVETIFYLFREVMLARLSRVGLVKPAAPMVLTFSPTNECQSRCKTCLIWRLYRENPGLKEKELKLEGIEKIFKSIGRIYHFNVAGGEPFLRRDLPEIVDLACEYLDFRMAHIPTNGIASDLVGEGTIRILQIMERNGFGDVPLIIKLSIDGVGEKHDEIRGAKGNFEKILDSYRRLTRLKKEYPNLRVGVETVISKFNHEYVRDIVDYVGRLDPDYHMHAIAEQRSELFTKHEKITPNLEEYRGAAGYFARKTKESLKNQELLVRTIQSFRLVFYDLVIQTLEQKRQVIPCYAGILNAHISPYGDVWPCSSLGYDGSFGNLRDVDYDFYEIWHSERAEDVRKYIKDGRCHSPNQLYVSSLCSLRTMLKIAKNILF